MKDLVLFGRIPSLLGKLAFLTGKLEPVSDWPEKLLAAYTADFGEDQ